MTRPVAPTLPSSWPRVDRAAFLDIEGRQVGHRREQAEAVVEDHGVARVVETRGHDHDGGGGRDDRRAGAGGEVGAVVRSARLAVQDAAHAESADRHPFHRALPRTIPEPLGACLAKQRR